MKCILCDRCKKVIEEPQQCRVITCARPLKRREPKDENYIPYRGDDDRMNDIIWKKDLCTDCAAEVEGFIEEMQPPDGGDKDTEPAQ